MDKHVAGFGLFMGFVQLELIEYCQPLSFKRTSKHAWTSKKQNKKTTQDGTTGQHMLLQTKKTWPRHTLWCDVDKTIIQVREWDWKQVITFHCSLLDNVCFHWTINRSQSSPCSLKFTILFHQVLCQELLKDKRCTTKQTATMDILYLWNCT